MSAAEQTIAGNDVFDRVCDLEESILTIGDLLDLIDNLGRDSENTGAITRLVLLCERECASLCDVHQDLFKMTHPDRAHFEKMGWPA